MVQLMSSTSWSVNSLLRIKIAWAVELYMQGKISSRAVLLAVFSTDTLRATYVSVVALMLKEAHKIFSMKEEANELSWDIIL